MAQLPAQPSAPAGWEAGIHHTDRGTGNALYGCVIERFLHPGWEMLGALVGHLNHPMMTEKLRHSGARLDNASQSRERQDKQKGLAKLLEPGNNNPAGWARAGGWHPFRQGAGIPSSSPRAAPALPCRAAASFVTRAIDGRAGAVARVMSRSESPVLLCQLTRERQSIPVSGHQQPPGSRHRIRAQLGEAQRAAVSTDTDAEEHGQDADGGAGS